MGRKVAIPIFDEILYSCPMIAPPRFLYGTAWKEDETARLVGLALAAGFTGIDTACQRKHYHEAGVGEALRKAYARGVSRDSLFLQTKFTSRGGQDHRLPYDPDADPATQVRQSFARSCEHLGTETIDSYVLHGPSSTGWNAYDAAVWRAMEDLHAEQRTRFLGASNVSLDQLRRICDGARVAPAFVQNRCYARTGWDREVRAFCAARQITYQGFSLLTANQRELQSAALRSLVTRTGHTPAQLVFAFALTVGMQPLTGTSSAAHMREDLAALAITLSPDDVALVERIAS